MQLPRDCCQAVAQGVVHYYQYTREPATERARVAEQGLKADEKGTLAARLHTTHTSWLSSNHRITLTMHDFTYVYMYMYMCVHM